MSKAYICTCIACGHRFFSDKMPLPKRRGLFESLFPKRFAMPPSAEGHISFAQTVTYTESFVPCPECGRRCVMLGAVAD